MTEQVPVQDVPPMPNDERRQRLDIAVSREVQAGGKLLVRTDFEATVAYGGGPIHLVLALITAGGWLLLYPVWRERRYVLAVNPVGTVWRRFARDEQWERVDL